MAHKFGHGRLGHVRFASRAENLIVLVEVSAEEYDTEVSSHCVEILGFFRTEFATVLASSICVCSSRCARYCVALSGIALRLHWQSRALLS